MGCRGGTKTSPVEHSANLNAHDCTLRDGHPATLDHVFTSKSTDFWIGDVTVHETQDGEGVFFSGEKVDTFSVSPRIATDYLLRTFLRKATQPPVERPIEYRASDRTLQGDGAGVEVDTVWRLGTRRERGVFSVPFKVQS
jgi:hypothetical protein